jgi:Dolichyl-phosphate-mannose-protein mannosyltransferase
VSVELEEDRTGQPARAAGRDAAARPWRRRAPDAAACLLLAAWSGLVVALLLPSLTRTLNGDEGWRAFYVSRGHDFWSTLPRVDAPLPGGWVALAKAVTSVLGNTELTLRLPMLLCLPGLALAGYALSRRVAGPVAAFLAAAALLLNNGLLLYATQFKQYAFEALATVLLLLCWLAARREGRPAPARAAFALGAGLCTVLATPTFFLLLPLVLVDAAAAARGGGWSGLGSPRWWREQGLPRAAVLAAALLPGAVHLATFVRLQAGRVGRVPNLDGYWQAFFPPAGGWTAGPGWVLRQLAGFVPHLFTTGNAAPPDAQVPHVPPAAGPAAAVLGLAPVVALTAAVAAAVRPGEARLRQLLVALAGGLAVELGLAAVHAWPFGWTRVNLFLVPLVYVLAAAGATRLATLARGLGGQAAGGPGRSWPSEPVTYPGLTGLCGRRAGSLQRASVQRRLHDRLSRLLRAGPPAVAAASLLALCGLGAWQALAVGAGQLRGLRVDVVEQASRERMRAVVGDVRVWCGPRDLAIVVIQGPSFAYYLHDYQGYPDAVSRRACIPADRLYRTPRFADPAAAAFVAARADAAQVFVFEPRGVSGRVHREQVGALRRLGYAPVGTMRYPRTGLLTVLRRAGEPARSGAGHGPEAGPGHGPGRPAPPG